MVLVVIFTSIELLHFSIDIVSLFSICLVVVTHPAILWTSLC